MEELAAAEGLFVRQQKEMVEVFTGFETANRYLVLDSAGTQLYHAAEVGGSFLSRNFFKATRPFTIQVVDTAGRVVLTLKRPFTFFRHRLEVFGPDGQHLGTIQRQWRLMRRVFTVRDHAGAEVCELYGPILRPWTFKVRCGGAEIGSIRKRWSGLLKEAFTSADHFGVQLPREFDPAKKSLLLGAVFLIDFVYFENSSASD